MRLGADECWARLRSSEHGVLATMHAERGVDAVPVVYVVTDDRRLIVPVDTVKQKTTTRLQRLVNLDRDPRCVLLVDEYRRAWSELWWVRVHGTATTIDGTVDDLERFAPYREPGTVVTAIIITPTLVTGWSA